jgi:single-strand DNA-binding protein
MNQVNIIGRLTADPILRFTAQGTAVATMRLARNERHGEKDQPLFVDVTVWSKQAECCAQHKKKGDQIAVSGRLEYSEYTDNEGRKHNRLRIVAHSVEFLARKNGNGHDTDAEQAATQNAPASAHTSEALEEEIPF